VKSPTREFPDSTGCRPLDRPLPWARPDLRLFLALWPQEAAPKSHTGKLLIEKARKKGPPEEKLQQLIQGYPLLPRQTR